MKYLIVVLMLLQQSVFAQGVLKVNGIYAGENKFIQNPYAEDLVHFCIDSIIINGSIYNIDCDKSALKLDFDSLKIPLGNTINILIYHKDMCMPKLLNPMSQPRLSSIQYDSISINEDGGLKWKSYNDSVGARPPFKIEHLKLNQWFEVVNVEQRWASENWYSAKVNFIPGMNNFRIKAGSNISDTIHFENNVKPVEYTIDKINRNVVFECPVYVELQTDKGMVLLQGTRSEVDLSFCKNGAYQIFYDNEIIKLTIRKGKIE